MNNIITHEPRDVTITTFGNPHGAPPEGAHITLDLRAFNPHLSPELRHLTARDPKVQLAVLNTPGIPRLIDAAAAMVLAVLAGPADAGPVTVAIGCANGIHQAPTVGMELAAVLHRWAITATLTHRDIDKDVVDR